MSSCSSRSAVRPSNRTCPFSRKTARSHSWAAMLRLCSTTTTVTPFACRRRTISSNSSTTTGARPSDSSSMQSSVGSSNSALAKPSCCCSPPDRRPAGCDSRSARRREVSTARAPAAPGPAARCLRMPTACISRFSSTVMSVNTLRPPGTRTQAVRSQPLGRVAGDVPAGERHRTGTRLLEARDDAQQRRLAGAVRAEEGEGLAVAHVERDSEQHLQLAVREVDVADGEQRVDGRRLGHFRTSSSTVPERVIAVASVPR